MKEIKGIFAASVSILDENLSLDLNKTINHVENLINQGCHGVAIFGSTGQAQLLSVGEKINFLNKISENKNKSKYLIGTGLNSLGETINFMKVSNSLGFKKFLIMPPAYYNYKDNEVIKFYSKIVDKNPDSKIILYNFEKLCGYKFSISCVEYLANKFPEQIVGVKDSSYNLFENLKIDNFSVFPGSELKLLKGLELGCSGIISATCNVTSQLARKVYEDFFTKKEQTQNEQLCKVRKVFDQFNLISGLHSFKSIENEMFARLLPPLKLLNNKEKEKLLLELKTLNFIPEINKAA